MSATFISLANESGIVCASDYDHTIYRLSKNKSLAIAVNPDSALPWESIINDFIHKGEIAEKAKLTDYVRTFEKHLSKTPVKKEYEKLSFEDSNVIFMGYGKNDLFPSVYDTFVKVCPNTGKLVFDKSKAPFLISRSCMVSINILGNMDSVSTLFWGAPSSINENLKKNFLAAFGTLKKRILKTAKNTEFEQFVNDHINDFEAEKRFNKILRDAFENYINRVYVGLDSFSIEEMVNAVETLVNSEVQIDYLKSGCKTKLTQTKEIAVITETEGFSWIKHSLYAI